MMQLVALDSTLALVIAARERALIRFLEFFASVVRNPHTRRAYSRAAGDPLDWWAGAVVASITAVQPLHVGTWIERQTQTHSAPAVKQHLAAIRHLFDWLVTGRIVPHNAARRCVDQATPRKRAKRPCSMRARRGSCSTAST
jgi:site-specific recombinase XerC